MPPVLCIGIEGAQHIARSLEQEGIDAVAVRDLSEGLLELSSRSFSAVVCNTDVVGVVSGATRTPVVGVGDQDSRFSALTGGATAFAPATDDAVPAIAQAVALVRFARRITPRATLSSSPPAPGTCTFRAAFSCVAAETLLTIFAMESRTARLCVAVDGRLRTELYVSGGTAVAALWNGVMVPAELVVRLWMCRPDAQLTAHPFQEQWPGKGEALDALVGRIAKDLDEARKDAA